MEVLYFQKHGFVKMKENIPPSEGYISQYTPKGVYGLIVNETYEGIISFMTAKMIYCPY